MAFFPLLRIDTCRRISLINAFHVLYVKAITEGKAREGNIDRTWGHMGMLIVADQMIPRLLAAAHLGREKKKWGGHIVQFCWSDLTISKGEMGSCLLP